MATMNNKPKDASDVRAQGGPLEAKGEPVIPPADKPAAELLEAAPLIDDFADTANTELGKRIRGEIPSIATPYPGLNKILEGGFRDGFYVLVGNTKAGKTQMAVEMSVAAAMKGHPVLYASIEIPRRTIYARMLSVLDRKPWTWLTREAKEGYKESNLQRLEPEYAQRLRELPIRIYDGKWDGAVTSGVVRLMKERLPGKPSDKPPFIVVDYLQRISRSGKSEDIRTEIGKVTETAAQAAKDTGASVLLISSTARNYYDRLAGKEAKAKGFDVGKSDPSSLLGTGKEAGEIEYDAHATLVLCTKTTGVNEEDWEEKEFWLAVAGARDIPQTGWVGPLDFPNGAVFVDRNGPVPKKKDEPEAKQGGLTL